MTVEREPPVEPVGARVVSGSLWVLFGFGANAAVNLARMVILARVLTVEGYGVAAAVLVLSRLVEGVGTMGLQVAAVQMQREPDDDLLNTVWTVDRLFLKLLAGVLLWVFAPEIAGFFRAPELTALARGLALYPVVMGLENNAMVVLTRQLDMRRRVQLELSNALGGAIVIPAALVWPSVWVVVISLIVGRLTRTIASYSIYPKVPRLRLDGQALKELFPFGRFIFAQNLLLTVRDQIDKLLLASLLGTAALGLFELAQRLGAQIIAVVDNIAIKVLFPVFARSQSDADVAVHRYLTTLEVLAIFVLPASALLALGAEAITPLIAGPGWEAAAPALRVLSLAAGVRVLAGASRPLIRGLGRSGVELWLELALVASIVVLVLWATPGGGVRGAATAVFLAYLLQVPLSLLATREVLGVSPRDVLRSVRDPLAATALAGASGYAGVTFARARSLGPGAELALLTATFGVVFLAALVTLVARSRSARVDDVIAALSEAAAKLRARRR